MELPQSKTGILYYYIELIPFVMLNIKMTSFRIFKRYYYKINTLKNWSIMSKGKIFNNTVNDNNSINTPKLKYCVPPYIKNVSECITRILKQFHIHLSHRPSLKIKNKLCNFKASMSLLIKQVWFIKCAVTIEMLYTLVRLVGIFRIEQKNHTKDVVKGTVRR